MAKLLHSINTRVPVVADGVAVAWQSKVDHAASSQCPSLLPDNYCLVLSSASVVLVSRVSTAKGGMYQHNQTAMLQQSVQPMLIMN